MPTFNQLVRKGRQTSVKKSTAPALQLSLIHILCERQVSTVRILTCVIGLPFSSTPSAITFAAVSYTHLLRAQREA